MKKILSLLYGALAYIIFLVAFLYAIGFVGNIYVPKTIDSGTEPPLVYALLINVILLSVFALQHSIMARPAFKKWFTKFIDPAIERSTYVLLSSLALLLIYWKWQPLKTVIWEVQNDKLAFLLIGLFFSGWLIVLLSTFMISHFQLFGLTQIYDNFKDRQTPNPKFQIKYFYTLVRHPIMLGFIIAFWATPTMTLGHLVFSLVTTVYILVAIKYLEEKDLRKVLGVDYENYQKEIPMILPFTKIKNKGLLKEG